MHYPIPFSDPQKRSSLKLLAFFHIFILTISNFLVQRTFEITVPFTDYVIHIPIYLFSNRFNGASIWS